MNYNDLWNEISNSLFTHVKNLISRAPYDKTFKAKVLKKLSDGKYQILYKNARYTARYHGLVNIGDTVHVCAPKNNWSELFILDGNHDKIEDTSLVNITAEDTSGVLGALGAEVSAQRLVDWIADQAMNQVLKKSDLVNNSLATVAGIAALDAAMGSKIPRLYEIKRTAFGFSTNHVFVNFYITDLLAYQFRIYFNGSSKMRVYKIENNVFTEIWNVGSNDRIIFRQASGKGIQDTARLDIPAFEVEQGTYLCVAGVSHCGVSNITNANAYWKFLIQRNNEQLLFGHNIQLNIPISSAFDNINCACSVIKVVGDGKNVLFPSFYNQTGISTDGTYNTVVSVFLIPLNMPIV